MSNNADRVYEAGRSTAGWKKGAPVRELSQLPDGTLFIEVSHSFQSENLAVVTEQRPLLPGVWAAWCSPDGRRIGSDVFVIHQFMLDPDYPREEEFFVAVPSDSVDTTDFIVVIEMRYADYEVFGGQQTPTYQREVAFATSFEALCAVDALKGEIELMDRDMQEMLNVYVRNQNVPRGDPLEALRETAAYNVAHMDLQQIRLDPYWGRFSDEDLERYKQKGRELA